MPYSALTPVSESVFAVLQDSTLLATLAGGWFNDVPQVPNFPFGWFEMDEVEARGFGTGGLPRIQLRTHVYSERGGTLASLAEAKEANRLTIGLLKDRALTVTGYSMCDRIWFRESVQLDNQELNGVKVYELVSTFDLYVEQQ